MPKPPFPKHASGSKSAKNLDAKDVSDEFEDVELRDSEILRPDLLSSGPGPGSKNADLLELSFF